MHRFKTEEVRVTVLVSATSVSVRSVMLVQAAQAVFLPHPRKCETDHLKTSHQRKRHFSSMWSELYYKQVSTGRRPPWSSGKFPTSVNGAGTKMAPVHGNHYGQLSVMLQGHALFCCTVAASRHAAEGANVNARVSNVRPSANVKVVVLITRVVITSSTDGQHYR